jgi:hypothetical protein
MLPETKNNEQLREQRKSKYYEEKKKNINQQLKGEKIKLCRLLQSDITHKSVQRNIQDSSKQNKE